MSHEITYNCDDCEVSGLCWDSEGRFLSPTLVPFVSGENTNVKIEPKLLLFFLAFYLKFLYISK